MIKFADAVAELERAEQQQRDYMESRPDPLDKAYLQYHHYRKLFSTYDKRVQKLYRLLKRDEHRARRAEEKDNE